MRCDDVYNKQFLKKMKMYTYIQGILQKDVDMCEYDDCMVNIINNREVFGIRSSIPRNSNAELKKQMVTVNDH